MWAAARAEKAANYILGTEQKIVDEEGVLVSEEIEA
jgi:hypothetical protein